MEYMAYNSHGIHDTIISMKCMIYGSKYEAVLKMLLLYLVEKAWRNIL